VSVVDDDEVCRLTFSPRDYGGGMGRLDLSETFIFREDALYKESVYCRRLVTPFPTILHTWGLAKAKNDTDKKKIPVTYRGTALAIVLGVRAINQNGHHFTVTLQAEEGNEAHCDLELKFPIASKKPNKAEKRLVLVQLSETFKNMAPETHTGNA